MMLPSQTLVGAGILVASFIIGFFLLGLGPSYGWPPTLALIPVMIGTAGALFMATDPG